MYSQVEVILCRSALYEALALGLRAPSDEMVQRLGNREQISALAEIAQVCESCCDHKLQLGEKVQQLGTYPETENLELLMSQYRGLFGHTVRGRVSPHETEYGADTMFQQPHELADISGFYRAFGLKMSCPERVDHIGCQCEFMSFLTRKEAYAVENDRAMWEETRKAQKLFLQHHLARFAPAFCTNLQKEAGASFYGALAELFSEFILSECRDCGVTPGPEVLQLRSTEWTNDCLSCGLVREK